MAQWVEGTVVERTLWTPILFSLKVDLDINPFKPGQFTSLALNIDDELIARPYSFFSPPHISPKEFFFYAASDGVLSNQLIKLQVGDKVMAKQQPNGFFILDEIPPAEDLWMLATGTGIAPFMSILKDEEVWTKYPTVVLVQAVRSHSDLLYQGEINALKLRHGDRFNHQGFVSREAVAGSLPGRIPAALENGSLEQSVGLVMTVENSQIMLCGNPGMIKESVEVLKARGFSKNRRRSPGQLTTEAYW